MKLEIQILLLVILISGAIGCSPTILVTVEELSTVELIENQPEEIFITTYDSKKYHFINSSSYYYFRNDTLFGKGTSEEFFYENGEKNYNGYLVMFEGNIPPEDISSIHESETSNITVTSVKCREYTFRNEGYYYLQNDSLFGIGELKLAGGYEEFSGSVALADIIKINSGLMGENKNTRNTGRKFNFVKEESYEGNELTILLKDGTEISGELLSARNNSIIICSEYGAYEADFMEGIYPVISVYGKEMQYIINESESKFMSSIGYGALLGGLGGAGMGLAAGTGIAVVSGFIFFAGVGAIVGGIFGILDYSDEIIFELPSDYDYTVLKSLARYTDEEPEFLQNIIDQ